MRMKEIVVKDFFEGKFKYIFEKTFPSERMSREEAIRLIEMIIIKESEIENDAIFRSFLNNKKGDPSRLHFLTVHVNETDGITYVSKASGGRYVGSLNEIDVKE